MPLFTFTRRNRMNLDYENIRTSFEDGIIWVTLNRSDIKNAFNDEFIMELTDIFHGICEDPGVRAAVLTGEGDVFSAGADLNWMKRMAGFSMAENVEDSNRMAMMFESISTCSKPVVGVINGPAIGGGLGLVSVCDISISRSDAYFMFSEVKLGLIPAVISPYVIRRIGPIKAKELFLTGERFDAYEAHRIGLVDYVCDPDDVQDLLFKKLKLLKSSGPEAMEHVKDLIDVIEYKQEPSIRSYTVKEISTLRSSDEGQEGIEAFLEKRKPVWRW